MYVFNLISNLRQSHLVDNTGVGMKKELRQIGASKVLRNSTSCIFKRSTLCGWLVGWLEFNVPFQHRYGYIRDESTLCEITLNVTQSDRRWRYLMDHNHFY